MQNYVNTQYCNSGSKKNRYGVRLTVIQNSQSIENNRSNITVTFELGGAGALGLSTDYTGSSFNGYTCTGTIYVNGVQKAQGSSTANIANNTKVTLASWTGNVDHNADGSLSIPIRGVFTGGLSSQTNGGEASGTVTFDTIPRASSVSCTTANIGAKPTFTITSAVSSFTHKLYYAFGSITKTLIVDSGLTGSTSITYNNWTIPTTFYAQIPNSPSGTGTITCETYSGTTYIGSKTCSFTVNVPSTAKPNISNPTIVDTDTVSKNTIQAYVVGKSKLQFTFPTFSTNYSSNLKSYTLKINNTQVYSGTDSSFTMTTPISETSNTYELIITDSRDIPNTTGAISFTAYAYTEPKITLFTVERNSTTPSTINITYSGAITNVNSNNRNAKSFKIEYKLATDSTWTTLLTATDAYTKTNVAATATNISDSSTFDFRITATDSYGSATASTQIGTSATLLNFSADGTSIAFGKASENSNMFECALNTNFTGDVKKNGNDILKPALDNIGTLSNLTTTAKTDTVSAINEVKSNVGTISSLVTTAKTDTVSAINELGAGVLKLRHYIRYRLNARYNTTQTSWTHTKINLNNNWAYKGNFTVANNGVCIGAGISTVLIWAHINFSQATTGAEFDLHIHKGTSSSLGDSSGWATTVTNNNLNSLDMVTILNVSQNNYIYLTYACGNTNQTTIYEDSALTIIAIN